jgi:hypothetical protein
MTTPRSVLTVAQFCERAGSEEYSNYFNRVTAALCSAATNLGNRPNNVIRPPESFH